MNNMFYQEGNKLIANRNFIAFIVYISLLLDNILLTVIVPILPDYLSQFNKNNLTIYNIPNSVLYKNFDLHYVPNMLSSSQQLGDNKIFNVTTRKKDAPEVMKQIANNGSLNIEDENESIAILLATKALVQLIFNPIVGSLSMKFGYKVLIFFGTFNILIASLVFALGESYIILLFARAVQGVGSACIAVCGMSLVAQLYPEEDKRSKIMGIILGSIALGVLIGYPFGGILYDFIGKAAPFIIIAIFAFINLLLQIGFIDFDDRLEYIEHNNNNRNNGTTSSSKWWPLLTDHLVFVITSAILISTSSMAILEPCLPIWLITNLHPKRWQLGTVFIPDSIGYLIGTNCFGSFAYRVGQIRVSVCALIVVGISCILIPFATSVMKLLIPHFCLGLGIGVVDAALVPLLATVVDAKYAAEESPTTNEQSSHYGTVYAIQQMAVSLAYSIVPLLGSELAHSLGFPWLMRIIGAINIIYGPYLFITTTRHNIGGIMMKEDGFALKASEADSVGSNKYKKFYNAID